VVAVSSQGGDVCIFPKVDKTSRAMKAQGSGASRAGTYISRVRVRRLSVSSDDAGRADFGSQYGQ